MKYHIKESILVSDLDGTLLPHDSQVCDEDIRAIKQYIADGGHFTLATGRMPDMLEYAELLGTNLPCIVGNGSVIYDYTNKKVLWEQFLDPIAQEAIPAVMREFPGLGLEMRVLDQLYVSRLNEQVRWHFSWEKQKYTLVNHEETIYNCHKMLLLEEHEVLLRVRAFLESNYPGAFDYVFSCAVFLEIIPRGCTKGDAIKHLKRICGMPNAPIFAMGDYGNDIKLLQVADVSGCPSTAIDEVKAVADIICKPVGEGAVAEFISVLREKYLI